MSTITKLPSEEICVALVNSSNGGLTISFAVLVIENRINISNNSRKPSKIFKDSKEFLRAGFHLTHINFERLSELLGQKVEWDEESGIVIHPA